MSKLKTIKKKHSGRDASGQVSVRHQGGAHKRYIRLVDFKRAKTDVPGKVVAIEYDPNRNADLALVQYADGDKRYIIAAHGLKIGDAISAGKNAEISAGNALPLIDIPVGTIGTGATVTAKEGRYAFIKLPSGEIRKILSNGMATIGQVGKIEMKNVILGKAGRKRNMGIRPTVRGVAQNPRSHPHGGGEGRSGIGMPSPKTFAGRKAVGRTRNKKKYSSKFIVHRRKGKR
jgi:large subunit ribosomal protein L2